MRPQLTPRSRSKPSKLDSQTSQGLMQGLLHGLLHLGGNAQASCPRLDSIDLAKRRLARQKESQDQHALEAALLAACAGHSPEPHAQGDDHADSSTGTAVGTQSAAVAHARTSHTTGVQSGMHSDLDRTPSSTAGSTHGATEAEHVEVERAGSASLDDPSVSSYTTGATPHQPMGIPEVHLPQLPSSTDVSADDSFLADARARQVLVNRPDSLLLAKTRLAKQHHDTSAHAPAAAGGSSTSRTLSGRYKRQASKEASGVASAVRTRRKSRSRRASDAGTVTSGSEAKSGPLRGTVAGLFERLKTLLGHSLSSGGHDGVSADTRSPTKSSKSTHAAIARDSVPARRLRDTSTSIDLHALGPGRRELAQASSMPASYKQHEFLAGAFAASSGNRGGSGAHGLASGAHEEGAHAGTSILRGAVSMAACGGAIVARQRQVNSDSDEDTAVPESGPLCALRPSSPKVNSGALSTYLKHYKDVPHSGTAQTKPPSIGASNLRRDSNHGVPGGGSGGSSLSAGGRCSQSAQQLLVVASTDAQDQDYASFTHVRVEGLSMSTPPPHQVPSLQLHMHGGRPVGEGLTADHARGNAYMDDGYLCMPGEVNAEVGGAR